MAKKENCYSTFIHNFAWKYIDTKFSLEKFNFWAEMTKLLSQSFT